MSTDGLRMAVVWGQVFEIAVKRGLIACLAERRLLDPQHPQLAPWRTTGTAQVYGAVRAVLGWEADALAAQANSIVGHLLTFGYGLGWTTMRAWLGMRRPRPDGIEALWCPLTLPAADRDISTEAARTAAAFRSAFAVDADDGTLLAKGAPAWSDFTLWVSGGRHVRQHALLVLEISYNVPHKTPDFRSERAHLDALSDYVRRLDNRGVFARVNAEVQGATPHLSPHLASHLGAFSGRDKPFFKLCQAASYAESTAALLLSERQLRDPLSVRAVAVTGAGLDSLAADMAQASQDPRRTLMTELAAAYRRAIKVSDTQAQQRLREETAMAFRQLARSLPVAFYRQIRNLEAVPEPGSSLQFDFAEEVTGFHRPTDRVTVGEALSWVAESPDLDAFFGQPAAQALAPHLSVRAQADQVSLRDVHAAAVVAGLAAMRPGRLTVLALEGNPGIGKTTAVQRHLTAQVEDGFLLLYVSPRTVINKDVTAKFARNDAGEPTGIATLTTNGEVIAQAGAAFRLARPADTRRIDSAVVVDGRADLTYPDDTSIWFMTPAQEDAMEGDWVGRSTHKRRLDARTDTLVDQRPPGVLRTLGAAAKRLIDANQDLRRLVLTASIQSYRRLGDGTTIAGLSGLFAAGRDTRAGVVERCRFAERFPTVLVMVDEVAGDGAGALFVEAIVRWLEEQLIVPFEQNPGGSPFSLALIVADASLGNAAVLASFMAAAPDSPEKVLVSAGAGRAPFRMLAEDIRLCGEHRRTLHVMTNSFPAKALAIHYRVRLHSLAPAFTADGKPKSVRTRIHDQAGELMLATAEEAIRESLGQGANQIIFFAQDKAFLGALRGRLVERDSEGVQRYGLSLDTVAILDSSVPAARRRALISEADRDRQRVFLMTSSGARGVSFPRATQIIAAVPRFDVEGSLMELAQLIYRGRGNYRDPASDERRSGDNDPRRLVMLIDDFLPQEAFDEDARSWLRRASDLLTLVMMLRGTIHTRITGDAGLPDRPLAITPVGPIGSSSAQRSMADAVRLLMREAQVALVRAQDADLGGLLRNAIDHTRTLFGGYRLQGVAPDRAARSFTDPATLGSFIARVAAPAVPLFLAGEPNAALPEAVHCIGPFWLESWRGRPQREQFAFPSYAAAIRDAERALSGQLMRIGQEPMLPRALKRAAREVLEILRRDEPERERDNVTVKALGSFQTWVAVPLDHPAFARRPDLAGERVRSGPEAPEDWLAGLARVVGGGAGTVPTIAAFDDIPFAAGIGADDPVRLDRVFDDRYFMATTELNLLNALLLAWTPPQESEC